MAGIKQSLLHTCQYDVLFSVCRVMYVTTYQLRTYQMFPMLYDMSAMYNMPDFLRFTVNFTCHVLCLQYNFDNIIIGI